MPSYLTAAPEALAAAASEFAGLGRRSTRAATNAGTNGSNGGNGTMGSHG